MTSARASLVTGGGWLQLPERRVYRRWRPRLGPAVAAPAAMIRHKRARLVFTVTIALLAGGLRSGTATAATPEVIFDSAVVDRALPAEVRRVLILEAAPRDRTSGRAADELVEGLARLGGTGVRVKELPAPSPAELDGGAAVELCAAHGTQALAIVEILTREPHLTVVAKLWTSAGARGAVLIGPAPVPREVAGRDSRYIAFDGRGAYVGVTRRRLEGDALYDAVGRHDLASSYRGRAVARGVLFIGGATTGTLGLLWMIGDSVGASFSSGLSSLCRDFTPDRSSIPGSRSDGSCRDSYRRSDGPIYSFAIAGTLLLAGSLIPEHPVGPAEREELARTHNHGLRPDAELTVTPYLLPDMGGVVVGGRF
jgi:hypothetical protein